MNISVYSEFLKGLDGYIYLFNTLTLKWLQLDPKLASILRSHANNLIRLKDIHPEFFNVLLKENFIIEEEGEDIDRAKNKIIKEYENTDYVKITINPTLDCNVRCWYCYEDKYEKSMMSSSMITATINFLCALIKEKEIKELQLSFFGGEPLLYFDNVVLPIIKGIAPIGKDRGTSVRVHFTTNGLLLSSRIIEILKDLALPTSFQIAFDGGRSQHNSVKFLSEGYSCYDKTIDNAQKAIEAGFFVIVRCNYNKKTVLSFEELIKDFEEFHSNENLSFSFQRIWQEAEDDEMKELRNKLYDELTDKYKFQSNINSLGTHSLSRCYADSKFNYLINYDGIVGRCTARNFTEEYGIGRLSEKGLRLKHIETGFEATSYKQQCCSCKLLPICPLCSQKRRENIENGCDIPSRPQQVLNTIIDVFENLSGVLVSDEQKKVIKFG